MSYSGREWNLIKKSQRWMFDPQRCDGCDQWMYAMEDGWQGCLCETAKEPANLYELAKGESA